MRSVTVDEVFTWKERTGFLAFEAFGRRGAALVNAKTWEEMKSRCDEVYVNTDLLGFGYLNSFDISISEDIPDGILQPRSTEAL